MSDAVVAVDVGGTWIKAALVTDTGVESILSVPSPGGDHSVIAVQDAISRLLDAAGAHSVRAVGLVVPGIVDQDGGRVVHSANLGWENVPLARLLQDSFGLPVGFGHDVRAAALAEYRWGAGQGAEVMVFTALGTGISAAVLQHGALLSAAAGEVGHGGAESGEQCACGGRGCLETFASAAGIARRYSERSGRPASGALDVLRAMTAGDRIAAAVWADAIEGLAGLLSQMVRLLGDPRIVIGGGLSLAGPALFGPLDAATRRLLTIHQPLRLVASAFGDRSGIYGAALLAWEHVGTIPELARRGHRPLRREPDFGSPAGVE